MITTVIADDEPMIVRGLSKLIDWNKLGFEIVGKAYDGKEALRLVREKRPGLLISDINMPDYSGIEILKLINAEKVGTQVVFISGFHDFEYAHAAIKFGAIDYLLKPVSENQLLTAISKLLRSEMTQNQSGPRDSTMPILPDLPKMSAGYFSVLNCMLDIGSISKFSESEMDILRFSAVNTIRNEYSEIENFWVSEKENHIIIVLCRESRDEISRYVRDVAAVVSGIITDKLGEPPIIAIGKTVANSAQINDSYFSSLEGIDNRFYYPDETLLFYRKAGPVRHSLDELYTRQTRVIEVLLKFDRIALQSCLDEYTGILRDVTFGNREATISHILGLVVTIKKSLESMDINLEPLEMDAQIILEELHKFSSFALVSRWLGEFTNSIGQELTQFQEEQVHPEIQKIKTYIEDHFRENIRLQDLSDLVYLHPNYLSSHFKKYTGKNFKDYLTEKRMEEAEKLLNISDMKVYEIAEQVGFTDYRHFSEVFKKTFGFNPREFRKRKTNPS